MVSVSRQKSRRAAIESLHHCMNPKHDQSYTQLFRKKEMIHDPSLQFQCLSGPQISKNHEDLNTAIDSCHPQPMQYESLSCSSEFRPPPSNFALEPQCRMTASLSIISPPPANVPMTSWNNQNYSSSCWPETQQLSQPIPCPPVSLAPNLPGAGLESNTDSPLSSGPYYPSSYLVNSGRYDCDFDVV